MTAVKFLVEKPEGDLPCNVFAFFPNNKYGGLDPNTFWSYAHTGQHSGCHIDYANECKEALYNQYADLLKELIGQGYKDLVVCNSQKITAHRKPTAGEIKFGEGATHYREFNIGEVLDKKGNIKKRFKADDFLFYSTL